MVTKRFVIEHIIWLAKSFVVCRRLRIKLSTLEFLNEIILKGRMYSVVIVCSCSFWYLTATQWFEYLKIDL